MINHKSSLKADSQPSFLAAVISRFFKNITFWKIFGLFIAILAWVGDVFLGWQTNIGYYFLGAIASWCVSENGL